MFASPDTKLAVQTCMYLDLAWMVEVTPNAGWIRRWDSVLVVLRVDVRHVARM